MGIKECDAYMDKFESCMKYVPDEQRDARHAEAESQRKVFRDEAQRPESRAKLAEQCATALDAIKTCH